MKLFKTALLFIISTTTLLSQNLHDDVNAASPSSVLSNDTNSTLGWTSTGASIISSVSTSPQDGVYAIKLESTSATADDRVIEYTFDAIISDTYNISIWVKEDDVNNTGDDRPEFSNWSGVSGFTDTIITTGTTWTEYTFSVTATSTTPIIRIYAHTAIGTIGDTVNIDNVSITNSTSDVTPPTAIVDLSSASVAETSLTLNWTPSSDNVLVTDYYVFKDGILESVSGTAGANTFNITGLTIGNSYDFTVFAIDAAGNISSVSNTLNETTVDATAPSAVNDLSASSVAETSLTLNWTAATDNVAVTDYEVFQDGVSIGLTGGANTFNVSGLTIGNSYDFTVFAKDAANNTSAVSNTLNETTVDATPPSAVNDLSAASVAETSLTLNWTAATDNVAVTDYEVFQDGVSIGLTGGANTFNVTGLTIGNSYDFTVFAKDAANNTSAVSNTLNETTVDATPPSAVNDLSAASVAETSLTLNWTAATDNVAVTDYEVFQDGVSIGLTGGANTFNVTGLTLGNSYDFTVFAKDAANNTSAVSNTLNETTVDATPPSAVNDLSAASVAETSLTLNWTTATDNVAVTDYEVFQDGVSIGLTGGANTFNVAGLTSGNSYDFTVFAKDAANNISSVSNTLNETTLDTTAPSAPLNLYASDITAFTANLNWTVSQSPDVVGYKIYQVGVGLIDTLPLTNSYSFEELEELTFYSFYVTAIDAANNESVPSNTVGLNTLEESSVVNYDSTNSNLISVDWQAKDILAFGNVGIGTAPNPNYKLAIDGNVVAEEVRVALKANWPDYVFKNDYVLPSLKEVQKYIEENGHLKDIPSAKEAEKNGISVGEMNSKLLRKIEELTLYIIQQEKRIEKLDIENKEFKKLSDRIKSLEKILNDIK